MKLLILGGSGQLGRSLLACDLDSFEVHAPTSALVNVIDFEKTKTYIHDLRPNFVVNATAWTNVPGAESSPEEANRLNAEAVGDLASACREIDSNLVHISTDYVFDGLKSIPYSEEDATLPLNAYGASKLAGEKAIAQSGIENFYIIRTSWLYSRFGKNFVKTITSKALKGESASITDDQFGSPTFAGDLAKGIASLIISSAKPGTYHFSNSGVTNWFEFGQAIYQLCGVDKSLVSKRSTEPTELKRPAYSPLALTKWEKAGLPNIRNWNEALVGELPDIIAEVKRAEK